MGTWMRSGLSLCMPNSESMSAPPSLAPASAPAPASASPGPALPPPSCGCSRVSPAPPRSRAGRLHRLVLDPSVSIAGNSTPSRSTLSASDSRPRALPGPAGGQPAAPPPGAKGEGAASWSSEARGAAGSGASAAAAPAGAGAGAGAPPCPSPPTPGASSFSGLAGWEAPVLAPSSSAGPAPPPKSVPSTDPAMALLMARGERDL
jgi:hypothetical protein